MAQSNRHRRNRNHTRKLNGSGKRSWPKLALSLDDLEKDIMNLPKKSQAMIRKQFGRFVKHSPKHNWPKLPLSPNALKKDISRLSRKSQAAVKKQFGMFVKHSPLRVKSHSPRRTKRRKSKKRAHSK